MFKPSKKQISSLIGGTVLLGIFAILAYAAVFFSPSNQPVGYVGQPAMSNYNVTSGNEHVYRGLYNNVDWSGQFTCYPVTANGYVKLTSPCFTSGAGSPLDAQSGIRNIGTLTDATTPAAVEFSTSGLTTAQQTALGGTANINWIVGTTLSPASLRQRTTVLGDIIHSRPYYWADATNPTVFVGANDGMLHAFDASTGKERWAYVPSMLITSSKMGQLPLPSYVHDYFVDGGLSIGTVGSSPALVGALGAGGKGLYALSLSSLTATSGSNAASKIMWEITNTGIKCGPAAGSCSNSTSTTYQDLGYTYSNPVVVPTQDGKTSVIVGNGYNNTGPKGEAALFVINAATGALIREIHTASGSTTSPNGLSSVTVIDSNGDGKADRAYAGDINGNMWVFDLSDSNPLNWTAHLLYSTPTNSSEPIAITMAPAISVHPSGGYMVDFATGRILSQSSAAILSPSTAAAVDDTADTSTPYAAYGLWDNPTVTNNANTTTASISESTLLKQAIKTQTYTPPTGSPTTTTQTVISLTTDNKPDWTTNRGWTVPLALAGGERVTGDTAFVDSGKFQFNLTNPTKTGGVNYLVELDYLNGGAGSVPFMDLNQDGVIDSKDLLLTAQGTIISPSTTVDPSTLIPVGYLTSNGVQSQPILIQLASTRIPLYNQNSNAAGTTTSNVSTGVAGGHFDVDVFWVSSGNFKGPGNGSGSQHVHEFDKNYDVNGLNPLNPNTSPFPLSTIPGVTPATTTYKILVMNQAWNRAMDLRIGTWPSAAAVATATASGVQDPGNVENYQTMISGHDVLYPAYYDAGGVSTGLCGTGNASTNNAGCLKVSSLPAFSGTVSQVTSLSGTAPVSGVDYYVEPDPTHEPSRYLTDPKGKIYIVNVTTTGSIGCTDGSSGAMVSPCSGSTATAANALASEAVKTTGARASVGGLELSMPGNGYTIKDWWSDGNGVQTGVMPITPGCAYNVSNTGTMPANSGSTYDVGPSGERHDGVLTVQIIKSSTPDADVQMNVPGKPQYGFRVIDSKITTDVIAEYTLYWHHPNAECMGDTTTLWSTVNNEKDPWFPAAEGWKVAASCSSGAVSGTSCVAVAASCSSGYPNAAGTSCQHCPVGSTTNTVAKTCTSPNATYVNSPSNPITTAAQAAGTYSPAENYVANGTYTASQTGFTNSTANSTSTTMGTFKCVTGGASNASGTAPSWIVNSTAWFGTSSVPATWNVSPAPLDAFTQANATTQTVNNVTTTVNYHVANGSTTAGPKGWTIQPPQDTASTLPICPTYTYTKDDPRTASFATSNASGGLPNTGGNGANGASLSSGMGGSLSPTNGGGGSGGSASGTGSTSSVSAVNPTNNQTGSTPTSGRINWRELIGL